MSYFTTFFYRLFLAETSSALSDEGLMQFVTASDTGVGTHTSLRLRRSCSSKQVIIRNCRFKIVQLPQMPPRCSRPPGMMSRVAAPPPPPRHEISFARSYKPTRQLVMKIYFRSNSFKRHSIYLEHLAYRNRIRQSVSKL
jgi:hypothetical protein